ncbi:MAG: type II toxin-antitoxin system RelE/ParE family toxin [Anaerolineae bacterium]
MYNVLLRGKAAKQLQHISPPHFQRLEQAIDQQAVDPRPPGAKQLSGQTGYRLRVGDYRILYDIDDAARQIIIYRIKHRRDVYR